MGHKVNPKVFRLGPLYTWESRWFANGKTYKEFVLEDDKIRTTLHKKLTRAGITKIEIERSINKINIILHVVRPGIVIGRGGQGLEELKGFIADIVLQHRRKLGKFEKKSSLKMDLKVEPVKEPSLSAFFMATQIAEQLAKRMNHKKSVFITMEKIMGAGAKGVKIILAGRINGAEISRRETYKKGSMPLSTIREDIDFAKVPSLTKSGYIGVKLWICK